MNIVNIGDLAADVAGNDYALFCDDCLNVMAKLPDNCVDMTCTSPPY